jgi:hypothetical protein
MYSQILHDQQCINNIMHDIVHNIMDVPIHNLPQQVLNLNLSVA